MAYIENPQSVQQYINNINESKNIIADKVVQFGLATEGANLKTLAAAIDGIVKRTPITKEEILDGIDQKESFTFEAGYYDEFTITGINNPELDMEFLESKTVTPTTSTQVIKPTEGSTYYGLSQVTVNAIPEKYKDSSNVTATADKVLIGQKVIGKEGNVIKEITGTMPDKSAYSAAVQIANKVYDTDWAVTIPKGYHDGTGQVTIFAPAVTATLSEESDQIIENATGSGLLSKVTVPKIDKDAKLTEWTEDATVSARESEVEEGLFYSGEILDGKTAYANGKKVTGSMQDYSGVNKECNLTNYNYPTGTNWEENFTTGQLRYTLSPGYYTGSIYVPAVKSDLTKNPDAYDSMELYRGKYLTRPDSKSFLIGVQIPPVPDTEIDATKILYGEVAYANGQKITGEMPDNKSATSTVTADLADTDGKVTKDINQGYYSGGTITFDYSNILTELAKI